VCVCVLESVIETHKFLWFFGQFSLSLCVQDSPFL
jgi:hypothetical protein